MSQKELRAISIDSNYIDMVEREIVRLFKDEIYIPLLLELDRSEKVLKNSTDDLVSAISSGLISFYRGQFKGRFNARLSLELNRLGAKWDKRHGSFLIPLHQLPYSVRVAILTSEERYQRTVDIINWKLARMLPEKIAEKLNVNNIFSSAIFRMDKDVKESLDGLVVTPEMSSQAKLRISEEYTKNLKLYIQGWTDQEIIKLRVRMQESVMSGARYEDMIDEIKRSYSVGQSKAKFLARQETNLLLAKVKEERYQDAGVNQYRWVCVNGSPSHPVRPMHKKNDGKIFSWDNPPIINEKGDRKNPQEDFGCRCTARPIVKF